MLASLAKLVEINRLHTHKEEAKTVFEEGLV